MWETNLRFINNFNSNMNLYSLKMNKFGDLTNREYRSIYLGFKPRRILLKNCNFSMCKKKLSQQPESVDWRERGYVTPVKDQGQCGSV